MTISPDARKRHVDEALRLMFSVVGLDTPYGSVYIDAEADPYSGLPATTWAELVHWKRAKKRPKAVTQYRLTGSGWIHGGGRSIPDVWSPVDRGAAPCDRPRFKSVPPEIPRCQ
jgi:hypothetical protein